MHAKTLLFVLAAFNPLLADPIPVRHPQGLLRGFLVLRAQDGAMLATGDLSQVSNGAQVTNQLVFRFKDGSLHDETAVFSQRRTFRLLSYHLVQKGPSFKRPTEMRLNTSNRQVAIRYTDDDGKEKTENERLEKLPADVANGLVITLLNDVDPKLKTTVSMVASTPKARLVKLEISSEGEEAFSVAGAPHKAIRYLIKVDIGGISGIIAPIIGKQPPDTRIWITSGPAPGFLKSEGPLCEGCPIWRVELASPVWPNKSE